MNFAVTCYSLGSVLEAFGLTCAVTIALTIYTLQSKRDFSAWGAGWVNHGILETWISCSVLFVASSCHITSAAQKTLYCHVCCWFIV